MELNNTNTNSMIEDAPGHDRLPKHGETWKTKTGLTVRVVYVNGGGAVSIKVQGEEFNRRPLSVQQYEALKAEAGA